MKQPKYRLLALDLDGTILDENRQVTPGNISAIKKACKRGVRVIIATGRMYVSALPFVEKFELEGPVITYNGALVKDSREDKILVHRPIDIQLAHRVITDTQKRGLHLNVYIDDQLYVKEDNRFSRGYEEYTGVEAKAVGPLLDFVDRPPTKMLLIEEDRKIFLDLLSFYQEKFAGRLNVMESKEHYLEFCVPEANKGKALEYTASRLNIPRSQVLAAGDSGNDLAMIKWAKTGVAVETAASEIKKEADNIAPPPQEDGIAYIVNELVL